MDLCLKSQRVSGHHAELFFIGNTLFIRDLGSTNGTFVNRQRVLQPTPVEQGDHIEIADVEFRVEYNSPGKSAGLLSLSELKKTVRDLNSICEDWVLSQFKELILQRQIVPHFQTIVDLRNSHVVGYESLARSSMSGLENPAKMFQTAELVNQEVELSVICRERAIESAARHYLADPIFVNTHPHENMQSDVIPSIRKLQQRFPDVQIVVEFHEKSIESVSAMLDYKARLDDMGVRVAYDDFGAGQSRLLELIKAPPHFLKFDRCLVSDIHEATPLHRKFLKSLVDSAHDANITTLAEGIETAAEAEACKDLGFGLGQGFLFSRPVEIPR